MSSPLLPLTRARGALIRQLLQDKRVRRKEGVFVIEGAKFCLDLVRYHPESILCLLLSTRYLKSEDDASQILRSALPKPQLTCSDQTFAALSDVEVPQGVLAIVRQPKWDEEQILSQARVLGFYGEQLQDPANVGAIIRTAAALNVTGLWLSPDSADCFSPKVVRATVGAIMTLPIFRKSGALATFLQHRCAIYSAVVPSPDAVSLRAIREVPKRLIVAVGNEGEGLAADVQKASTLRFSIPLVREVESLNVAATVAISAFHFGGLPPVS